MAIEFKAKLDASDVESNLKSLPAKAAAATRSMGESFAGLSQSVNGFAAAIGGSMIARGVMSIVDFAGEIQDSADAVRMSAEEFQGLSTVMGDSGVSQERFARGMASLNSKVVDAIEGNAAAAKSFSSLGISIASLKEATPAGVLAMIAAALSNATNEASAMAAASDLLGARQSRFVAALRQQGDELKKNADLTYKLSDAEVERVERLGDAMKRAWGGTKTLLSKPLSMAMQGWEAAKMIAGEYSGKNIRDQSAAQSDATFLYNEQKEKRREALSASRYPIPGLNAPMPPGGDQRAEAEITAARSFAADIEKMNATAAMDNEKERRRQNDDLYKRQMEVAVREDADYDRLREEEKAAADKAAENAQRDKDAGVARWMAAKQARSDAATAIGGMGADARRQAMRDLMDKSREEARTARLLRSGQKDARAFSGKLIGAEMNKMGISESDLKRISDPMVELNATIKNNRIKFPVLR